MFIIGIRLLIFFLPIANKNVDVVLMHETNVLDLDIILDRVMYPKVYSRCNVQRRIFISHNHADRRFSNTRFASYGLRPTTPRKRNTVPLWFYA